MEARVKVPGTCGELVQGIKENKNFQYLVFAPRGIKNNKAILLLHGLNERKWDKYYTWGHKLAKDTGKSVILIPFSFHLILLGIDIYDYHMNLNLVYNTHNLYNL